MTLLTNFRHKNLKPGVHQFLHSNDDTGLSFSICQLAAGETIEPGEDHFETAALVIHGSGTISSGSDSHYFNRPDWIKHSPWAIHLPPRQKGAITARTACKIALLKTRNQETFPEKTYLPSEVSTEHRGKGQLDDTCYRHVRLVFDRTIAPPEARLVLGEVLNYPGRWSSYPPHHHRQPEIYYYEFSPSEGYGHGELGNEVYHIRHQDLLKITENRDHSQVAAPGYHLYYLWAIRHLDNNPYTGFEFTPPHDKLLS